VTLNLQSLVLWNPKRNYANVEGFKYLFNFAVLLPFCVLLKVDIMIAKETSSGW
jgi:hypothetical protein